MTDYKVQLDIFEGPLDLLLHLIKEEEINIYDIPISKITKQYFEYLELLKEMDLDVAGEWLIMAATLTHIKSKMLLPVEPSDEEDDSGVDPRDELVQRLLEYKKFKEAAGTLKEKEEYQKNSFGRDFHSEWDEDDADFLKEVSVYKLLDAFNKILKTASGDPLYEIRLEEVSVTEKMASIMEMLETKSKIRFEDLFVEMKSRMELVATLLGLLELMKQQMIRVFQEREFGPIWIQNIDEGETESREGELETVNAVINNLDVT
jgi:segregation and condensation protein A